MQEIKLAELRADDVGNRAIVLIDGNTVEGSLESFWVTMTGYKERAPHMQQLTVQTESAEFKLKSLPLDFVMQIERMPEEQWPPPEKVDPQVFETFKIGSNA